MPRMPHTLLMSMTMVAALTLLTLFPCLGVAQTEQKIVVPDALKQDTRLLEQKLKSIEQALNDGKSQKPTPQFSEADIEAINSIRQQMGGGVAEQFKQIPGIDAQALSAEVFDAELKRRAGIENGVQPIEPAGNPLPRSTPGLLTSTGANVNVTGISDGMGNAGSVAGVSRATGMVHSVNQKRVETLRSAARHLDLAAADLEDVNLFDQADEMRRQASRLRGQARNLQR